MEIKPKTKGRKMRLSKEQLKGSIRLTMKNIWEERFPFYGQLNYLKECELGIASTFTTIVWLHGDYHAHIMSPYLCYSGTDPITYTKLSTADTIRIIWIGLKTYVRECFHYTLPKLIKAKFYDLKNKIKKIFAKKPRTYDVLDFLE